MYWGVRYLVTGNFYSLRRGVIWPEQHYKSGMIRRIQKKLGYQYLVETGTYLGDTSEAMAPYFDKIWTTEIDKKLFDDVKIRLAPYMNVRCHYGSSADLLPKIIPEVDKPAIFFLDAHYSGPGTGESKNPIEAECKALAQSKIKDHIIVIDDISDFSKDRTNIALSEVIRLIEDINPTYTFYFDYDMLFALPGDTNRSFWRKIAYPFVIR